MMKYGSLEVQLYNYIYSHILYTCTHGQTLMYYSYSGHSLMVLVSLSLLSILEALLCAKEDVALTNPTVKNHAL